MKLMITPSFFEHELSSFQKFSRESKKENFKIYPLKLFFFVFDLTCTEGHTFRSNLGIFFENFKKSFLFPCALAFLIFSN